MQEVPKPHPQPGWALIRVLIAGGAPAAGAHGAHARLQGHAGSAAAVCSTDQEIVRGYVPGYNQTLGHEFVVRTRSPAAPLSPRPGGLLHHTCPQGVVEQCTAQPQWEGKRVVGMPGLPLAPVLQLATPAGCVTHTEAGQPHAHRAAPHQQAQ